jgi:hypothetical protein
VEETEDAGRVIAVDGDGAAEVAVTGLSWRREVCQQVFEEAAVDCGRALAAWSDSLWGKRKGKRVGFPRFKKKTGAVASFRLRNKHTKGRPPAIRVGDNNRPRSVTLPGIGPVAVHDDTRRLPLADGTALTGTVRVRVKPARLTRELTFTPHPRPEPTTPEKGGAEHSPELFDTL